jgi:hypothetical protein
MSGSPCWRASFEDKGSKEKTRMEPLGFSQNWNAGNVKTCAVIEIYDGLPSHGCGENKIHEMSSCAVGHS